MDISEGRILLCSGDGLVCNCVALCASLRLLLSFSILVSGSRILLACIVSCETQLFCNILWLM